jgi:hypothetical protein
MRTFSILMAAGSLATAAMVSPQGPADAWGGAWDAALAEAALKCGQVFPDQGAAVVLDGVVVWSGPAIRELTRETLDGKVGSWDDVVDLEIICRPEFERLGVSAHEGFYMLTRGSGAQYLNASLREIHALQEAHRKEHGGWAGSLQALGFAAPDARLSLEVEADAGEGSWIARGTHAMSMRRCAVSGREGGVGSGDGSSEDPAAPTCRRMVPTDEAFPRLVDASDPS